MAKKAKATTPAKSPSPSKGKVAKPASLKAKGSSAPKEKSADAAVVAESPYSVGDRVRHHMFEIGTVVEVDGDQLLIEFMKVGVKRILSSFVDPLRR